MFEDGSLGCFSVIATLETLGLRRRSGKIQVVADGDVYGLQVDGGRVILATSSNQALRLGLLLLRRGLVEPLYLQDVLRGRRPVAERHALGRTLVMEGAISRADLAAGVEEQCVEVISRILDFDAATFLFAGDDPVVAGIEVIPLDTDRLFTQATHRQRERLATRAMDLLLPPPNVRLKLAVQLALISVKLTDPELLVALAVDRGTTTLDGLAVTVPLDRLTLRRTVIGLMERGYLVVATSPFGVDRR
ncbi:MAG: hypothetical protein QOJ59_1625 [Thermomicrobiales bacterium]|jgi:hypothetical protein|nr:hypothetical protein [Thermomicrobiales bacterium]MEA2523545.1 hypothetical protein [Thermomicrobiales bacterium]